MHVALAGTPGLNVKVFFRDDDPANPGRYRLTQTNDYRFDFFAPHAEVGKRRDPAQLPVVNNITGLVTATTPGVYLFQLTADQQYLVGRLQVHNSVVGWW